MFLETSRIPDIVLYIQWNFWLASLLFRPDYFIVQHDWTFSGNICRAAAMYIYVYDLRFFGPSCLDKKGQFMYFRLPQNCRLDAAKKISFSRALTSWGRMESAEQKKLCNIAKRRSNLGLDSYLPVLHFPPKRFFRHHLLQLLHHNQYIDFHTY